MLSAIMTVFNGQKHIRESINSVLGQTYKDFELIIVNDGSVDRTLDILHSFNDTRIKIIDNPRNFGVGKAILTALSQINGEYIAKVDGDDIYHPERFEKQLNFLIKNPHIDVVDSKIEYFADDENIKQSLRYHHIKSRIEKDVNSICSTKDLEKYLYWFVCITHSSIMYRKQILNKASYRELRIGEDYDLFYRWNKCGVKMYKLNDILTKVRISNNSTTVNQRDNMIEGILDIKHKEIDNLSRIHTDLYIWGTGGLGSEVYEVLKNKYAIKGFIDGDPTKEGTIFKNKMVASFEQLEGRDIGILIAASVAKFEIVELLEERKLKHLQDYLVIF